LLNLEEKKIEAEQDRAGRVIRKANVWELGGLKAPTRSTGGRGGPALYPSDPLRNRKSGGGSKKGQGKTGQGVACFARGEEGPQS